MPKEYTPAERVLDSENAIGEKSSVTHCRLMRARREDHMSTMRSPLIVNGLNLLHMTFPTFPSLSINLAPDSGASGSHTRAIATNANKLILV